MAEAVTIGVISHDTGDDAYDDMCLQRCLKALGKVAPGAGLVVLRSPHRAALADLVSSHSAELILLLDVDTEPRPGFLSRLLAARVQGGGGFRVYSPRAQGVLSWPPLSPDWAPTTASRFPRQAVLLERADWSRLGQVAEPGDSSVIEAIIDAADEHVVVDDAAVLSHRPQTLAHDVSCRVPRFDITRCGGAVMSAASADLTVARAALRTWLELSTCGVHEAREALHEWQAARSDLGAKALACLPRWMTHCDLHVEGIIHESLLCPSVIDESRNAVVRDDFEAARMLLMRHPHSYCAAVAVMALAPDIRRSDHVNGIPTVITQGWFDSELPIDAGPKIESWAGLHPRWEHRLFDSDAAEQWLLRSMGSEAARTFRGASPVAKANLFRYAYLAQEGGVWSDIDDRAVSSIDDLVEDRSLVVLRESLGAIGDNFIAVTPGHPVLMAARDEAFLNESNGYAEIQWLANGPAMFTRKVAGWVAGAIRAMQPSDHDLDYAVVPVTRMVEFVSMHERLDYKSTPLAWDAHVHRPPSESLYRDGRPVPQSARQRVLMESQAQT